MSGSFPLWQLALLFCTGTAAGFVDSIAGGGGLITLPVFLSFGLPPKLALGTNKLQATFGSGSAAFHYWRAGAVSFSQCFRGFLCSLAGSALGTTAVRHLHSDFLARAIPVLLFLVAIYALLRPRLGETDLHPRMPHFAFDLLFGLALGFYDGFLGPGTGSFWTMAFVLGLGFSLLKATAATKIMNLASNLSSLAIFLFAGEVLFAPGLAMGAGQLLGARLGSSLVISRGARVIRPVFITIVLALLARLLYHQYG